MSIDNHSAPWGYDSWTHTEVVPKPPPWRWTIGPVRAKTITPVAAMAGHPATGTEEITVQLTADQQVSLTLSGEDRWGNPVDIGTATAVWESTDESVVQVVVDEGNAGSATAVAVGPVGVAAVTVSNEAGDVSGGIAIQVVAGEVTEVVVTAGEPEDKPYVDPRQ